MAGRWTGQSICLPWCKKDKFEFRLPCIAEGYDRDPETIWGQGKMTVPASGGIGIFYRYLLYFSQKERQAVCVKNSLPMN